MAADKDALRAQIRLLISDGALPCTTPDATHAAPGDGRTRCDICGDVIPRSEMQYEEEFKTAAGSEECTVVAHRQCRNLWLAICKLEFAEFHHLPG
jgi:hypothetical protein